MNVILPPTNSHRIHFFHLLFLKISLISHQEVLPPLLQNLLRLQVLTSYEL